MIRLTVLFMLALIISALPCAAQERFAYDDFSSLPVLHEGRVKPLDSFARIELRKIYGAETIGGHRAIEFLARALFDPASAAADKIFTIRDPQLKAQMGLSAQPENIFSLQEISAGLGQTEKMIAGLLQQTADLTPAQMALLDLHDRAIGMVQILGAVNMVLPLNENGDTWLDLQKKPIPAVMEMRRAGQSNTLFRIMPPALSGRDEWTAPWAAKNIDNPYLRQFQAMAHSYRNDDAAGWAVATKNALTMTTIQDTATGMDVEIEKFYMAAKPLRLAEWGYGLALLMLVAGLWQKSTWGYWLACALATGSAMLHTGGIGLRVMILDRPPVGTLYESLLFVSLIAVIGALLIEWARRDRMALLGGLAATLGLLYAAPVFAPSGDSMEMLVAVLNTGFWLATHVICITAGYGVCVLAAMLAHFALLRPESRLDNVIHKTLIAGLFLTGFGTMLGGIWADQSWGRFWGWDPKENGALLIVLWLAWMLHGRMGGHLRGVAYRVSVAYLNVIVAIAWFGVNLLNVGLHSYGFTNEMAAGLALFCGLETALMAIALYHGRRVAQK